MRIPPNGADIELPFKEDKVHKVFIDPTGNHVIIINADKIALTGNKMGKELYSHSGRPGGLRRDSYAELLEKNPERIIKNAVKGMLPKNRLAKVQLDRLRIFRGAEHPHTPQKPQVFEIAQVSQQAK